MKYTSTRDATKFYTFEEALFSGYAPDGGLFVPLELPRLWEGSGGGSKQQKNIVLGEIWPELSFAALATEILHPFCQDEIPKADLGRILEKALSGFESSNDTKVPVVPLVRPGNNNQSVVDCYVAELFHGPTYCFKDLGMRATIFLMGHFAASSNKIRSDSEPDRDRDRSIVLTAATTGDTGPAAVRAVEDLNSSNLGIVVHYPEGQISDFQRKQMTTIDSDRVEIVSFEGGGDDMDGPIKNIMMQKENNNSNSNTNSNSEILVCGVNSYNIGRPLMQMVHFVWTYLRVVEDIEQKTQQKINHDNFELDVVIPTGAMGNIAGCYMAKKMGIPFGNLCAGVNVNDITHRAFSTGIVRKPRSGEPMKQSLSDAINIQLPYNLERLLFYLTDQDHTLVKTWYERLEASTSAIDEEIGGSIDLTTTTAEGDDKKESSSKNTTWLKKLQAEFRSAKVTDDCLCDTIQHVLETYGYWIDPHTGVAFDAAKQLGYFSMKEKSKNNHLAIMATASPCKFEAAMTQAVGKEKWKDYEDQHFPPRGKVLKEEKEIPPTRYLADPQKTLEENQLVWEASTRALIAKLGR